MLLKKVIAREVQGINLTLIQMKITSLKSSRELKRELLKTLSQEFSNRQIRLIMLEFYLQAQDHLSHGRFWCKYSESPKTRRGQPLLAFGSPLTNYIPDPDEVARTRYQRRLIINNENFTFFLFVNFFATQ